MKPEISIVMPVYNREDLVGKAIESILNQSFSNFEFIIIDDCSNDRTVEVIKAFNDERIILIENEEKQNIPKLRNQGLKIAQGKYIATMDSDDLAMVDRLIMQKEFLDENPDYGLVGSDVYTSSYFDEELRIREMPKGNELLRYQTAFICSFVNPSTMIRKSVLDQHNIWHREDYFVASDYALQVDLLPYTKFENLSTPCLTYYFHRENITNTSFGDAEKLKMRQGIIDKIRRTAVTNLGLNLTKDEEDIFVGYTGESNKILPPYDQFEKFKDLLNKLETNFKDEFGLENILTVHEKMIKRVERNYIRQSKDQE